PGIDRTGADDGGVAAQRARQIGHRAARRVLNPVVIRARSPETTWARPGVAVEVGQRAGLSVPRERVLARLAGHMVAKRAVLGEVPGSGGGPGDREARPRLLEARIRIAGLRASAVVEEDADRGQLLERRQRARISR